MSTISGELELDILNFLGTALYATALHLFP